MVETIEATLLRIHLAEGDKSHGHSAYEVIVKKAREAGLAGATVLRGPLGFGHSLRVHTAKILQLSENLPMVIEIIDQPDKVEAFIPVVNEVLEGGLITMEKVRIVTR
jgi:PII-like signaling protein